MPAGARSWSRRQKGWPARQRNSSLLVSARQLQAHVRRHLQHKSGPVVQPIQKAKNAPNTAMQRAMRATGMRTIGDDQVTRGGSVLGSGPALSRVTTRRTTTNAMVTRLRAPTTTEARYKARGDIEVPDAA